MCYLTVVYSRTCLLASCCGLWLILSEDAMSTPVVPILKLYNGGYHLHPALTTIILLMAACIAHQRID